MVKRPPVRHWIKDAHFRSLLKNSSYLGVSKAVAAVAGIATLAFAGRGLGVVPGSPLTNRFMVACRDACIVRT